MLRYQSFRDAADLRQALTARSENSTTVLKLHVGACWNGVPRKMVAMDNPKQHDLDRRRPSRAPLRLDIDLTDYTQLGVARDALAENDAHWPILALAITITKRCLRHCFGLDEVLTFYSGRRGVHLWVLDERAWRMDDATRGTLIEFLSCPLDSHGVARDTFLDRTPWYSELFDAEVLPSFVSVLKNSEIDVLASVDAICRFEQMMNVAHREVSRVFRDMKFSNETQCRNFYSITNTVNELVLAKPASCAWIRKRLHAAVLTLMWPRFDKGASMLNHLIKAPFSVHSSTGRIAVPLRDDATNFSPRDAPAIGCEDHRIQSAEGDLRDNLAALGVPKPWSDPLSASWASQVTDLAVAEVKLYDKNERRAKRRKLGINDGIDRMDYVIERNLWGVRVGRTLEVYVDQTHIHMRTQLCAHRYTHGVPIKLTNGLQIAWTYSTPVDTVWNAVKSKMHTPTQRWTYVVEDEMLLLFNADRSFSAQTKKRAEQRVRRIVDRSHDDSCSSKVSVRRQDSSYLMWSSAFPEVVRLWPVPGVVALC